MKHTFILILLYITLTVFYYLFISCIGLIWFKWNDILYSHPWNIIYCTFIGWWIAIPVCIEYYEEYIED